MASTSTTTDWVHTLFDTIYRAYNDQDAEATANCYAPDVRVTINGEPGPDDRTALVEALQEQWVGFPDVRATEMHRLLPSADQVITEMWIEGRNTGSFLGRPATGKLWRVALIWVCRVAGGQVQELRVYIDNRPLQAALSTHPPAR